MMRGVSTWAVAIRHRDGHVAVEAHPVSSWVTRSPVLRFPVIRGVVALAQSMAIGAKALRGSIDAQETEPIPARTWAFALVAGLALAIGLFFALPVLLTSLIEGWLGSAWLFWLVEGGVRNAIFLTYLALLARQPHLRRLFQYHGAEHKTIAAYEAGLPLTVANAQRFSRLHPRCGTSFLLVVMVVAIFVFAPVGLPAWWILLLTRIVGVPLVAGISFELIKFAGRHRHSPWVRPIIWPGMQLQKLTTREPEDEQVVVAVAALEAVLAVEDPRAASREARIGVEVAA
ncbi:DUF1385 domain-containing protein [Solirubrobacter sp. CPCC 204708]|nr:DUF1385 domain-containing protein [Solirubrobacter deserti]